jgi:hypothetical protein
MQWLTGNSWLGARILVGITIFAIFAALDLYKNGRAATRWREYLFLFSAAAVAIGYGALNDQVTSSISWEYFYFWKGLDEKLGSQTPPDALRLHWEAAKIGMQAAWTLGLLAGAALVIANNPSRRYPRAPYRVLWRGLPIIIGTVILCSAMFAVIGHSGGLDWISQDLREEASRHRPERFMTTWGIHLGGYIGAPIGIVLAVWRVRRARGKMLQAPDKMPCSASDC